MLHFPLNVFALSDALSSREPKENYKHSRWRSVCERRRKGQVSPGSTAKFMENMNQTCFFVVVLPLTYLYKHNFCLPMLQSLPSFLNCPLAYLL